MIFLSILEALGSVNDAIFFNLSYQGVRSEVEKVQRNYFEGIRGKVYPSKTTVYR